MKKQLQRSALFLFLTTLSVSNQTIQAQTFSAGAEHALFACSGNVPMVTGRNNLGQLGNGTNNNSSLAIPVSSLNGIIAVAGGEKFSMFLKNNGTVWACGENVDGQLADGTTTNQTTPVQSGTITGVMAIAGGG